MKNFEKLERRTNPDTFQPEMLICDKWIPLEPVIDNKTVFGEKKTLEMIREEYGDCVADFFIENS